MALIFESWRADGIGQSRIDCIRSDTKDWLQKFEDWLARQEANPECVLITKNRTDRQSHWEHIIWQRPGYQDPVHKNS